VREQKDAAGPKKHIDPPAVEDEEKKENTDQRQKHPAVMKKNAANVVCFCVNHERLVSSTGRHQR
jgi:hypothetical protein